MKERPILFSTEMVRAVLAGRKTQTRGVVKPDIKTDWMLDGRFSNEYISQIQWVKSPYGTPGDLLYVRESWNATSIDGIEWKKANDVYSHKMAVNWNVRYKANADHPNQKWLPSIHMPKKFARIWLKVHDVRVERVQDISEADAIAEGIDMEGEHTSLCINIEDAGYDNDLVKGSAPLTVFKKLWNSIEKRGYGWDTNPWVWVVEFERIEK